MARGGSSPPSLILPPLPPRCAPKPRYPAFQLPLAHDRGPATRPRPGSAQACRCARRSVAWARRLLSAPVGLVPQVLHPPQHVRGTRLSGGTCHAHRTCRSGHPSLNHPPTCRSVSSSHPARSASPTSGASACPNARSTVSRPWTITADLRFGLRTKPGTVARMAPRVSDSGRAWGTGSGPIAWLRACRGELEVRALRQCMPAQLRKAAPATRLPGPSGSGSARGRIARSTARAAPSSSLVRGAAGRGEPAGLGKTWRTLLVLVLGHGQPIGHGPWSGVDLIRDLIRSFASAPRPRQATKVPLHQRESGPSPWDPAPPMQPLPRR